MISPKGNCFIAFSGAIGQIKKLTLGLSEILEKSCESTQYEIFLKFIRTRFDEMWQQGDFQNNPPEIALIYADIRHVHGSTRCKLLKLECCLKNLKPHISELIGAGIEFVSIGWTPEGRRMLSSGAANALGELESRNLLIVTKSEQLSKLLQNHPSAINSVIMDSSGERNSTFRKKLRAYCNSLDKDKPSDIPLEPMLIFGGAAKQSIEFMMQDLRKMNVPMHDCVGDNWTLVTLTRRYGFRVHSNVELQACLGTF